MVRVGDRRLDITVTENGVAGAFAGQHANLPTKNVILIGGNGDTSKDIMPRAPEHYRPLHS